MVISVYTDDDKFFKITKQPEIVWVRESVGDTLIWKLLNENSSTVIRMKITSSF